MGADKPVTDQEVLRLLKQAAAETEPSRATARKLASWFSVTGIGGIL